MLNTENWECSYSIPWPGAAAGCAHTAQRCHRAPGFYGSEHDIKSLAFPSPSSSSRDGRELGEKRHKPAAVCVAGGLCGYHLPLDFKTNVSLMSCSYWVLWSFLSEGKYPDTKTIPNPTLPPNWLLQPLSVPHRASSDRRSSQTVTPSHTDTAPGHCFLHHWPTTRASQLKDKHVWLKSLRNKEYLHFGIKSCQFAY